MLQGNMLIAHGGGPTPVINSSLLGAVTEAKRHSEIQTIFGARFGAEGILAGDLMDLGQYSEETLALLARTPASALGSCRRKLTDADYPAVLECFKKYNILSVIFSIMAEMIPWTPATKSTSWPARWATNCM